MRTLIDLLLILSLTAGLFAAGVLTGTGYQAGQSNSEWQKKAVQHDCAIFRINDKYEKEFVWKDELIKLDPPPQL